jgi:ankyrin repeat protein
MNGAVSAQLIARLKPKRMSIQDNLVQVAHNNLLLYAAGENDVDRAIALLSQGARIDYVDSKDGQTPLHKACSSGNSEIVKLIIQRCADVDARDFLGNTPLHVACSTRNEGAVKLLIEGGADVNKMMNNGETALHVASNLGTVGILRLLLETDVEIDVKGNDGRTPLHKAAIGGSQDTAEMLLQFRAAADVVDHWGQTALHLCLSGKQVEVMEVLLRYGADVNLVDDDGNTVLHKACQFGRKDVVKLLLKYGADADMKGYEGMSALQLAKQRGLKEIVDLLAQYSKLSDELEKQPLSYTRPMSDDTVGRPIRDSIGKVSENPEEESRGMHLTTESNPNLWSGVRRDNGDGFVLASYDNHDISFDAKLESIRPCVHEGREMHEIQLKLNFMRPYSMSHRIRYAQVDAIVSSNNSEHGPHIRGVLPQADRMEVSEQEITSGQKFTVGAAGTGGPSNVNISMEGSKTRKSTYKGVRIIHGAIRDRLHASWRLYEEPGSKSGLPEIVRLLLFVNCEAEFDIRLSLSAKACYLFSFGIPRTLTAPEGPVYSIPKLDVISAYDQESRLRQMLDVADRAAMMVEEADELRKSFSQAIRAHKKKHLIMQAGAKESCLQEWSDIVNASKSGEFTNLREMMLAMEESAPEPELDRKRRQEDRLGSPAMPRRWPSPGEARWDNPPRAERPRMLSGYQERRGYNPASQNALESFSAVGPGYNISRLA